MSKLGCSTTAVSEFSGPNKRKRRPAGTPDPGAEVVALSPKTLMESDRYVCEICNQGFQRDQNLQMHRRRHKVPWKLLKKPSSLVSNRRVYICPERSCLHHDPSHALGDLVGIKKHYRRKHCTEKQWKCVKCSKRYAVQSDYKAHMKTCGTRGHCCDCGRVFSRVESFIEHQDSCSAAKRKATTQSNSSLLHHHTTRLISSDSSDTTQAISFAHVSDTADVMSTKFVTDEPHPGIRCQIVNQSVALPFWLVARERRSELELLPSSSKLWEPTENSHSTGFSMPGVVRTGTTIDCSDSPAADLIQLLPRSSCGETVHAPCLRLSIGPASSAETASSCLSTHPSIFHVDHRKPRLSSVERETLASNSHRRQASVEAHARMLERSAHSTAIGKDLALSIPEPGNQGSVPGMDHAGVTSDFLQGQTTWLGSCNEGLCQSMKKHPRRNRSTESYYPCSER